MTTYTNEQIEAIADACEQAYPKQGQLMVRLLARDMLRAWLAERKAAREGVTDAVVNKAFGSFLGGLKGDDGDSLKGIRAALEAVATMVCPVASGEAAGYFLRNSDGIWEQVAHAYRDDPDVVPLYTHPAEPVKVPEGMVLVPRWKLDRAATILESDGDEHGVARDLRSLAAAPGADGEVAL